MSGKLIVFEGIDSSGKSTQAQLLAERLQALQVPVVSTREPGGTPIAELIREVVLRNEHSEMLPLSELLLFIVSRAQNTHEVIAPALRAGKTVVASRYRMSSLAYQGYGRGIDLDLVRRLNEAATNGQRADVTFLVDLPVEIALARKEDADRIEDESIHFHQRVRDGFLELARDDESVIVVDGRRPPEEIAADVARHLGL
ncbi:dTMP kinase [Candidatus Bipolaricaulota bacterium]|nr:dTMP kinase [Candidatus Bipolaricaulota bacterium]